MTGSPISRVRSYARALQNRPRVSSGEDPDFHAAVLQLIQETHCIFEQIDEADEFLARAASYASTAHAELALAAVQGLLETVGEKVRKTKRGLDGCADVRDRHDYGLLTQPSSQIDAIV